MSVLNDRSPAAVLPAAEANLCALWRSYSRLPGAECVDRPDLFWVATDIPFPAFNGVVRARPRPEELAPTVAATLERFARRQVPMLWLAGPGAHPADLGAHLVARGLTHLADDPVMAADLRALPAGPPVPAGFASEAVQDLDALRAWCGFTDQPAVAQALAAWGQTLGFAPDRAIVHFLGRLDGRPVATATLVLGGGVAGVYNVMTVPDAQRRGIGALMTVRALEAARARGYRVATLQSSRMGYPLYRRLGFEDYGTVAIYLWPGARP